MSYPISALLLLNYHTNGSLVNPVYSKSLLEFPVGGAL